MGLISLERTICPVLIRELFRCKIKQSVYSAPKLVKALGKPSSLWQTVWGILVVTYLTDEETEGCIGGRMTAWGCRGAFCIVCTFL